MLEYLTIEHIATKDLARFFSKIFINNNHITKGSPCWDWCQHISSDGYGRFRWKGDYESAHRFSFAAFIHLLPRGDRYGVLDHLCRRPLCVNPCHLDFVTSKINTLRGTSPAAKNAAKTQCKRGHLLEGNNVRLIHNGQHRVCRVCVREQIREIRRANPEMTKEQTYKWRAAHKEKYNAYMRAYRERKKVAK